MRDLRVLCLHVGELRLRGDEGALERTREGLRLCDDAAVDLWEIEREAGSVYRMNGRDVRQRDVDYWGRRTAAAIGAHCAGTRLRIEESRLAVAGPAHVPAASPGFVQHVALCCLPVDADDCLVHARAWISGLEGDILRPAQNRRRREFAGHGGDRNPAEREDGRGEGRRGPFGDETDRARLGYGCVEGGPVGPRLALWDCGGVALPGVATLAPLRAPGLLVAELAGAQLGRPDDGTDTTGFFNAEFRL